MQPCNVHFNRRGLTVAACLAFALVAQAATAGCPPGYQSKAGHCIPRPMQTHHPVRAGSFAHAPAAVSPVHADKHHSAPKKAYASHSTHHAGLAPATSSYGYDLRAQHEAKSVHGIIFVGGKQALNPQPIPPGHVARAGAPTEKKAGH
ncbi:MAG TPA: hypothetical protein VJ722_02350 [Rhodanobacteraceae bacterium]|nr:hypothetical protein [Rhodanobacteraceae bacterium]